VGDYQLSLSNVGFGYLQRPDGQFSLFTAPGSAPQQTFFISVNNHEQILGAYLDAAGNQKNFPKMHDHYRPFDLPRRSMRPSRPRRPSTIMMRSSATSSTSTKSFTDLLHG